MSYRGLGKCHHLAYSILNFITEALKLIMLCFRSSHCASYLQGMEEGEGNSKLGETSCVTRFIRMLLSLVSELKLCQLL